MAPTAASLLERVCSRHRAAGRLAIAIVGALLLAAAGSYAWSLAISFDTGKKTITDAFHAQAGRPAPVEGGAVEALNILPLGADGNGAVGQDLDSIRGRRALSTMVVHIPADRDAVHVVSILRDNNPVGFGSYHLATRYFATGPQTMNGQEALAFVREQYSALVGCLAPFRPMEDGLDSGYLLNLAPRHPFWTDSLNQYIG
jgi:anionic cell wall polymer biosynthesis LytR-Cps2A-Psr (LCP) family protein